MVALLSIIGCFDSETLVPGQVFGAILLSVVVMRFDPDRTVSTTSAPTSGGCSGLLCCGRGKSVDYCIAITGPIAGIRGITSVERNDVCWPALLPRRDCRGRRRRCRGRRGWLTSG
jgi:hypothetical protein